MELSYLQIPNNKIEQLKRAGINSIEELARFYPKRYEDFRKTVDIADLEEHIDENVAMVGRITAIIKGVQYVTAQVEDDSGNFTYVTWFNQMHLASILRKGERYVFFGKIFYNLKLRKASMTSPVFYSNNPLDFGKILPVYKKIKGMSYDYLTHCIERAVSLLIANKNLRDEIPKEVLAMHSAPELKKFLVIVHQPNTDEDLQMVKNRLVLDELYPFAYKMTERKLSAVTMSAYVAHKDALTERFVAGLPFTITDDQRRVLDRAKSVAKSGRRVDALVQGDVSCGKTIVAIALSVLMAENGYQTAVMAPTTVLAEQHCKEFQKYLAPMGIEVVALDSKAKKKERDATLSKIADGSAAVVVGTHSVISDDVQFKNLAMTVIDEEHRFGVEQRQKLRSKARNGVHSVSMTATPIPRTLALTLYGESTEVMNITTMPSGRKPVMTVVNSSYEKVFEGLGRQVKAGHQCYIVCPMIDVADNDAMADVESVDAVYKKLKAWVEKNKLDIPVDRVTGDLKPDTIKQRLQAFSSGKTKILISTTIVEVGVNVPNATVMVISNAERFGLATLHQLRGRVGRSDIQSFCVLLTKKATPRIRAMLETNNGFEISQRDLELRGSGNIVGVKQHGFDGCVTLMLQYPDLYNRLCRFAEERISKNG